MSSAKQFVLRQLVLHRVDINPHVKLQDRISYDDVLNTLILRLICSGRNQLVLVFVVVDRAMVLSPGTLVTIALLAAKELHPISHHLLRLVSRMSHFFLLAACFHPSIFTVVGRAMVPVPQALATIAMHAPEELHPITHLLLRLVGRMSPFLLLGCSVHQTIVGIQSSHS